MQAIMESVFDVCYLILVITVGIMMMQRVRGDTQTLLFGAMAVVLGGGDSFHLVPRIIAEITSGFDRLAPILGLGRMITSITMTLFYVLFYHIWRMRYDIKGRKGLTLSIYLLALVRIILTLLPQNEWMSAHPPLAWGIYRNIPFAVMGIIIIVLFQKEAVRSGDKALKYAWLAVLLSFAFYIPVVLWADTFPVVGVLMIPKTCAYAWLVMMGYMDMRRKLGTK